MTSSNRVYLFDTTLRDGAQTQGVDFTVADKVAIARELDLLGIDYIEGGWPGANPTDDRFFADPPEFQNAKFVAFGMTRRAGRSAANDPGLAAILQSKARTVCMVGKTWDFHVDVALEVDRTEYLAMISDSLAYAKGYGRGDVRRRAFLRRLQGQSRLRDGLPRRWREGGRALAGAVRHQRRDPAARGRAHRRRSGEEDPGRSPRH